MKNLFYFLIFIVFITNAQAHNSPIKYRPESHAPAGVMTDHMHKKGEWMFGVRSLATNYDTLFQGSEKISTTQAASLGYSMVPTKMSMKMHMLDIMYAYSDNLTLMFMPQYMTMDMSMESTGLTSSMMHHSGPHQHNTSGVGDTVIGGLIQITNSNQMLLHGTLAVSIPTGAVDEKINGKFTHYGMQLGSGTWDFLPSITYSAWQELLSWGIQGGANLRLEGENNSGYVLGEKYYATGWSAYRFKDWCSGSIRTQYTKTNPIRGHYNGSHNHASPPDFQRNYGGEIVELGIGLNLVPQAGRLRGVRLGLEWLIPIDEHYNGVQLAKKDTFNISLGFGI